jgi:GntR family transcriptional repressor for pyruvate dehydrogenase complex
MTTPSSIERPARRSEPPATEQVVAHVRSLIEAGTLGPGQRLPAERELAKHIGVSRPSVRAALGTLVALGVVETRHGAGTFVAVGPPMLVSEPLRFLAALHGFTDEEMFESRRVLEVGVVELAAERAKSDDLAAIADAVAEGFASLDDPLAFLVHDIRFHRAVAAASGNPILAAVVEMVSALRYEQRRLTAARARDLARPAKQHRSIYQAIRAHDRERAQVAMNEHLRHAQQTQASEEGSSVNSQLSAALGVEP